MIKIFTLMFLILTSLSVQTVNANPIQWKESEGGNNHFYEYIANDGTISWQDAKLVAESQTLLGVSGHLATFTSLAENNWFAENIMLEQKIAFFGGIYDQTQSVWSWVTGETWDFTHWHSPEPNDIGSGLELYTVLYTRDGTPDLGEWYDVYIGYTVTDYIIEYDVLNEIVPIPEPMTAILLGSGIIYLIRKKDKIFL